MQRYDFRSQKYLYPGLRTCTPYGQSWAHLPHWTQSWLRRMIYFETSFR